MKNSLWPISILLLLALGARFGVWTYRHYAYGTRKAALTHREVATRVLAEYVASHYPGKRALVMSNPFTQKKGQPNQIYSYEEAGINGLRKGFGNAANLKVVFPDLRPEFTRNPQAVYIDPKTTTPLSYLVTENSFGDLAKQNPECQIIISLIGLPLGVKQSEIWRNAGGPGFALLLPDWRVLGDPETVRDAFKSGKIIAAVMNKPGAPPENSPLGADVRAEFDKRFLLATPENLDQLYNAFPKLF